MWVRHEFDPCIACVWCVYTVCVCVQEWSWRFLPWSMERTSTLEATNWVWDSSWRRNTRLSVVFLTGSSVREESEISRRRQTAVEFKPHAEPKPAPRLLFICCTTFTVNISLQTAAFDLYMCFPFQVIFWVIGNQKCKYYYLLILMLVQTFILINLNVYAAHFYTTTVTMTVKLQKSTQYIYFAYYKQSLLKPYNSFMWAT